MNTIKKLKDNWEGIHDRFKANDLDAYAANNELECALLEYALEGYTDKEHNISEEEKKRIVTHYTSIHTLVSMLESSSEDEESFLRMYDSAHSNDPGEGNFLTKNFPTKYTSLIRRKVSRAYIASFILSDGQEGKGRDNLVFWRAYGRNGEGCSLSFPALNLYPILRKVRYGRRLAKDLEGRLKSFFNELNEINSLIEQIRKTHPDIRVTPLKIVGEHLEKIRYLYKSDAYEYERECRLVLLESDINPDKICFECSGKNDSPMHIRHYFEQENLEIKKLLDSSDCEIVIGPSVLHPDDVQYCIQTLLKRADLTGPSVIISDIDYRKS